MNLKEFTQQIAKKRNQLDDLMRRQMPVKIGAKAKAFYQDNISERQGFLNGGVQPWQKTRRQLSGSKSANANYGALLSSRNHLYSGMTYRPGNARVTVGNYVAYAGIHNRGGTVSPTVTPKMRKWAWMKYYQAAGKVSKNKAGAWRISKANKQLGSEASFYKSLALTKKKKLNIHIPRRQFLGESRELNQDIRTSMDQEIRKIINN